jgi:FtsZ-binding cell division protein ZapB
MSEFAWNTEVVDEAQQQDELGLEPEQELEQEPEQEPETLAICVDDFAALEERIVRAVELVKRERLSRAAAEERAASAEAELERQAPMAAGLEREVKQLRAERDHVRQRVERLLSQLDALEL